MSIIKQQAQSLIDAFFRLNDFKFQTGIEDFTVEEIKDGVVTIVIHDDFFSEDAKNYCSSVENDGDYYKKVTLKYQNTKEELYSEDYAAFGYFVRSLIC